MRLLTVVFVAVVFVALVLGASITSTLGPASKITVTAGASSGEEQYVLVGGQNGTWFRAGQAPRLYELSLSDYSVEPLVPVSSQGTVWTGGWNGSQWLISGWGRVPGPHGSNPYIYLYDGQNQIVAGTMNQSQSESSWRGGDIFAASYNGTEWLLSGLGSGVLTSYDPKATTNHMSLATFDGYKFTDLSNIVPEQRDAILYANAWNGRTWLVGGGYHHEGVLFLFNGSGFMDLTPEIEKAVRTFASVQCLAWNGEFWLIGGIGFLAKYDGSRFADLTAELTGALNPSVSVTVNAVSWNGSMWMLGGGTPVAQLQASKAWAATFTSTRFTDISSELGSYGSDVISPSSILTITSKNDSWIIGGYLKTQGTLYAYLGGSFINLSNLVSGFSYVDWVGAGTQYDRSSPVLTGLSTSRFLRMIDASNPIKKILAFLGKIGEVAVRGA